MLLQSIGIPSSDDKLPMSQRRTADANENQPPASRFAALQAENRELRGELEQLRTERNSLLERQSRIMELIGAKAPEHLVHDLRNVLNERELLRALTEDQLR